MTDLLYRHQQILTALRDSTDGLTNKQIIEHCKKMRPNEVPNDITQMGLNTSSLRKRDLVTTKDTAAGKIHYISTKGLEVLAEARGEPMPQPTPALQHTGDNPAQASTRQSEPSCQEIPDNCETADNPSDDPYAIVDQFDRAAKIMRDALVMAVEQSQSEIRIANKSRKIATLEALETMVAENIADMLRQIRDDLQLLEAE